MSDKNQYLLDAEYKVGVSFNPGQNPDVVAIKESGAKLIAIIQEIVDRKVKSLMEPYADGITTPPDAVYKTVHEVQKQGGEACTAIEDALMKAVTAATKPLYSAN